MRIYWTVLFVSLVWGKPKHKEEPASRHQHVSQRIQGGESEYISEIPFMVTIHYADDDLIGGGTILTTTKVLTSAQNVYGLNANFLKVQAGTTSPQSDPPTPYQVWYYNYHPDYKTRRYDYNVAVVTLRSEFIMDHLRAPVVLADCESPYGSDLKIAGYGPEIGGGPEYIHLWKKNVTLLPDTKCEDAWGVLPDVVEPYSPRMGCITGGACPQDLGGPVFRDYLQVGVMSQSQQCHPNFNYLTFFIKVTETSVLQFIHDEIQ